MAFSPSPQQSPLVASRSGLHTSRLSMTPPPTQPLSKRDKRRNATLDRLNDISASFAMNRDIHYRAQLQSLQLDMNYISRANPYQAKPLDEPSEENLGENPASTSNTQSGAGGLTANKALEGETSPGLGRWSAKFVEESDNAMEERDAQLAELAERHVSKARQIEDEKTFGINVVQEEHDALAQTIRDRLIHTVTQKKNRLVKDKEHLDIADTNALLYHPSQFSITNPTSPGGVQSNRKTRHTRHKLDIEDLGTIGDSNKRKRKAPADADNGSPAPPVRAVESETVLPWKESQSKLEYHQMAAPLYSIDRLFTEKELSLNLQKATYATIEHFNNKRAKISQNSTQTNGFNTDAEDPITISTTATLITETDPDHSDTAPEMDRTASQSVHITRSTRNNNSTAAPRAHLLGGLAGRASAISLVGATFMRDVKRKEDENHPPGLSTQEIEDDLLMMTQAMDKEAKKPGWFDKKLAEDVCPSHDEAGFPLGSAFALDATATSGNEANNIDNSNGNANAKDLGALPMSAQPSLTGLADAVSLPMSRVGSAVGMKRSASAIEGEAAKRGRMR